MDTGTLLAGWCAFVVGLMAYRLLPVKRASPAGAAKRALQMQGYATGEEAPWWYNLLVLLEPLARRAPSRSLLKTEEDLYWAKLAGQFLRWDPVHLWCLRIGLALAALGFGITFIGDLFLVGVLAALSFAAPGVVLRNRARAARKSFLRELPEIVELLRLEVASGVSMMQALQALSERANRGEKAS
jgi:Flp pilus assembly protein TadB